MVLLMPGWMSPQTKTEFINTYTDTDAQLTPQELFDNVMENSGNGDETYSFMTIIDGTIHVVV
jgi:hypothetical protein